MPKKKIAVIVGPTACGKTDVAVRVARRLNGEVVSADSVQVYERLDIGSAKPTKEEMDGVPHHLIGEIPLDAKEFSVAAFQALAMERIDAIQTRGKLAVVAGGTGLYINSLVFPMDFTQAAGDSAFRAEWNEREEASPGAAHEALRQVDPQSAERLHPNDRKRVIRALEIYHLTGKTLTQQTVEYREMEPLYPCVIAGLTMPREMLYKRIEQRVDRMLEQGLVQEVQSILEEGYDPAAPSLQGLGYKEIVSYLRGECSLEAAREIIVRETRHFAKRQWTWFRRDKRTRWFEVPQYGETGALADAVCRYFSEALTKE